MLRAKCPPHNAGCSDIYPLPPPTRGCLHKTNTPHTWGGKKPSQKRTPRPMTSTTVALITAALELWRRFLRGKHSRNSRQRTTSTVHSSGARFGRRFLCGQKRHFSRPRLAGAELPPLNLGALHAQKVVGPHRWYFNNTHVHTNKTVQHETPSK